METKKIKRVFDLGLKLDLVKQIEEGKVSVREISSIYQVSTTAIYKWLRKYSDLYRIQTRVIVEKKSLSKKNKELEKRVKDLEASLGRKQMRVDYLERIITLSSERLGEDLEKKNN